jgi:hypothetical protein
MEFDRFNRLLQAHVATIFKSETTLFVTDLDKEKLWNLYLDSFPAGTNQIFRQRREYDCSCCRNFTKSFGNVVAIQNGRIVTIWDFKTHDSKYQQVIDALANFVRSARISDVFVTKESGFGTDKNHEKLEDGTVRTWHHFRVDLPQKFINTSSKSEASVMAEYRDVKNVFARSLTEISRDAIETVIDLIAQNSLYKGEEWQGALEHFCNLHSAYCTLPDIERDNYCWQTSVAVGGAIGKIRNTSMGVLLTDITNGDELNEAVRKYEAIVAPTNYKRPQAIFTKKTIEQAQKTISELGLLESLERRFATIEDITVNNILFANKDTLKQMSGDIFTELKKEAAASPKQFERVEEIPVEQFVKNILPRLTNVEVLLENQHVPNLVSLIAPQATTSPSMFKWDNGFSWAYNGNITDSMKQRVKAAGGNVDGVLRFSLQWNDNGDNQNDFDAHCVEPNNNHIYYPNKGQKHPSTGVLDVDIIHPDRTQVAVENITWTDISRMQEGMYKFYVNNYSHRGGHSGFTAELEYGGQIYTYVYDRELHQGENVIVAKVKFSRKKGIEISESLPSSTSSKTIWNIQTNEFHPVSVCMFSPNYWDERTGIGHRHYFFMLKDCQNDTQPNGFFNEFLREDLLQHKRVFEALGAKMRVAPCDSTRRTLRERQLSGLGFSSTKRNALVCKLQGHINRMVKVIF